jgi:hypothetical protein
MPSTWGTPIAVAVKRPSPAHGSGQSVKPKPAPIGKPVAKAGGVSGTGHKPAPAAVPVLPPGYAIRGFTTAQSIAYWQERLNDATFGRPAAASSWSGGRSGPQSSGVTSGGGYNGSAGSHISHGPTYYANPETGAPGASLPSDQAGGAFGLPGYQAPYDTVSQILASGYPAFAFSTDLPGVIAGDPIFGNPYDGGPGAMPFSPTFAGAEGGFSNSFDGS